MPSGIGGPGGFSATTASATTYLNLTSANGALKELYDDQKVQNLVYKNNPALALIRKNTDFEGKYKPVPLVFAPAAGRSSNFSVAWTAGGSVVSGGTIGGAQGAPYIQEFLITRATDYAIATIDRQTLMASRSNAGAFIQMTKVNVDGAIRAITNSLSTSLFRAGTGTIAQTSAAGFSSGVATLQNVNDIVQFEVNMALVASTGDGSGAVTGANTTMYVIAVDRTAGTVTVSASPGGAAGLPAGLSSATQYYLQVAGDYNAKLTGFAGWVPSIALATTTLAPGYNFFNVDRSQDKVRLGGFRYDGSSFSIEEALIDGSNYLAREGGMPDVGITNFASYSALVKALGSKIQYIDAEVAEIAFKGVQIHGATGPIRIFPDRSCNQFTCYLLTMDTWALDSLDDAPHIQTDHVTGEMLRVYNADAAELRVSYYAQTECNAPGWSANILLGA